jgi:hypothetical protein
LPAGILLSSSGDVLVQAGVAIGENRFRYKVCERSVPGNCAEADAWVTVPATARLKGTAQLGMRATAGGVSGFAMGYCNLDNCPYSGNFDLRGVPAGERVALTVDWSGRDTFGTSDYDPAVPTGQVVHLAPGTVVSVSPRLQQVGVWLALDQAATPPETEAALDTLLVAWDVGSLRRADDTAPSTINAQLSQLLVLDQRWTAPGDFTAIIGGQPARVELFGTARVDLFDGTGLTALTIAAGQTVWLRIPADRPDAALPATATLMYYDAASARWVPGQAASLVRQAGGAYYEGTIDRLGTWAAASAVDTVTVRGCLRDIDGRAVPNAWVQAGGIDHGSWAQVLSDGAGRFALPVARGGQFNLFALGAGSNNNSTPTDSRTLGPFDGDADLPDCLTGVALPAFTVRTVGCNTVGSDFSCLENWLADPTGHYFGPRGESSYPVDSWQVVRPLVGTYRLLTSTNVFGPWDFEAKGRRTTLQILGHAPEAFTLPEAVMQTDGGYWQVFEIDVDSRCVLSVRRQLSHVAALPTLPAVPAQYCKP